MTGQIGQVNFENYCLELVILKINIHINKIEIQGKVYSCCQIKLKLDRFIERKTCVASTKFKKQTAYLSHYQFKTDYFQIQSTLEFQIEGEGRINGEAGKFWPK